MRCGTSRLAIAGQVLDIVYPCIATHLVKQAGISRKTARTGAVTLIQRFGSALHPNIHCHMLFLDGMYVERPDRITGCCPREPVRSWSAGLSSSARGCATCWRRRCRRSW